MGIHPCASLVDLILGRMQPLTDKEYGFCVIAVSALAGPKQELQLQSSWLSILEQS
jgi:hypothetical protein